MNTPDITRKELLSGEDFAVDGLSERLKNMPFPQATLLRPRNILLSFQLNPTYAESHFSKSYGEQRNLLSELLAEIWGYSPSILRAISSVPREAFVKSTHRVIANWNGVSVVMGRTAIESPWLLAYTATTLKLSEGARVLILGSGTGYSVALAGAVVGVTGEVIGIELNPQFVSSSVQILCQLGAANCRIVAGDVFEPMSLGAFDVIWPTLATPGIPQTWMTFVKRGSRLCAYLPDDIVECAPIYEVRSMANALIFENQETVSLASYEFQDKLTVVSKLTDLVNRPFFERGRILKDDAGFAEFDSIEDAAIELLKKAPTEAEGCIL